MSWTEDDLRRVASPHVLKQLDALRESAKKPGAKRRGPKSAKQGKKSKLEETLWRDLDLEGDREGWVREYIFHPVRQWRLDFAHPELKIGVECDGLLRFGAGRHQTVDGFTEDAYKKNEAAMLGWIVLSFTVVHIVEEANAVEVMMKTVELRRAGKI